MADILVLTEPDLRRAVPLDRAAIDTVEAGFAAMATGKVAMPPILRLDIPEFRGEVDVKTAYVPGISSFAIKISPGFFDNPKLGLPSLNGLMVLFSAHTGLVEALLLDNGYLTAVRTAAAGAVAARHLSRPESRVVAIFGAGEQARLQLEALTLVRPVTEARIWARSREQAETAAAYLTKRLGFSVTGILDPAAACAGADIIVTTTPAEAPVLRDAWLEPGQHITAMGSDAEHKNEIDPAIFARARYVADSLSQTRRLGELAHAIRAGIVADDASFPELGAVIAGTATGRHEATDITLADLTGTGVQDTAIATFARSRAAETGAGRAFDTTSSSGKA